MAAVIELNDDEWKRVEHFFDPKRRRGVPAHYSRREMVDAMLFLARTGCQWRYLPDRYAPWSAVWQQWRRWRENGVWARAMVLLARTIRRRHHRSSDPTMVMIDAQTVKGGPGGSDIPRSGRSWRTDDPREAEHSHRDPRTAARGPC